MSVIASDWATLRIAILTRIEECRALLEVEMPYAQTDALRGEIRGYRGVLAMAEPPRKHEVSDPGY